MSAVFLSVMFNLVWNARDSILRDWLQSVQSHRICVAGTPAFQLASLVDIAGWKWAGAMVMNRVTQYCFTPDSKQVCGGLSHVFRFDGILKLCVWVLVQSTMVNYWQCSRTDWLLTGVCCQRWEPMNENAQLFGLRWKETASAAQWHCCARQRACFFFYWRGMCLISWKYSLDPGGAFIPYFITLEGLLCVCSFLLCLPQFLPARPIWSPDSQVFYQLLLMHLLQVTNIPLIYMFILHKPSFVGPWGIHAITDKKKS